MRSSGASRKTWAASKFTRSGSYLKPPAAVWRDGTCDFTRTILASGLWNPFQIDTVGLYFYLTGWISVSHNGEVTARPEPEFLRDLGSFAAKAQHQERRESQFLTTQGKNCRAGIELNRLPQETFLYFFWPILREIPPIPVWLDNFRSPRCKSFWIHCLDE